MTNNKLFYKLAMFLMVLSLSVSSPVYSDETDKRSEKPLDGELLLPDDYNKAEEKKCVMVCDKWGEDCILNPRTGSRNCRRVCKSFAEECF
ncbi:MAG: hypothetical protein HND53_14180 [Proteobacteria bacterium]|nr:hypothetical protein [Pseudomonadota bacterium]NOG61641.1 hypothetical protein [Pseudomonadota bacterium]